jgi:8-oxo-dGTP diphosphatase
MYVTAETIREVEQRYGTPVEIVRQYEMIPEQLGIVRLGQKHGRCHDVTLVIVDNDRNIVVTRKSSYPLGAYRTPSGGVELGESFDEGAIREAKEETGLDIVLEKYLIRANVRFRCGSEVIDWTTHVLQARATGGTLQPLDTKEIVEARTATISEITGPIREALLASGSPGLRYRAELDGLAMELINTDPTGLVPVD